MAVAEVQDVEFHNPKFNDVVNHSAPFPLIDIPTADSFIFMGDSYFAIG